MGANTLAGAHDNGVAEKQAVSCSSPRPDSTAQALGELTALLASLTAEVGQLKPQMDAYATQSSAQLETMQRTLDQQAHAHQALVLEVQAVRDNQQGQSAQQHTSSESGRQFCSGCQVSNQDSDLQGAQQALVSELRAVKASMETLREQSQLASHKNHRLMCDLSELVASGDHQLPAQRLASTKSDTDAVDGILRANYEGGKVLMTKMQELHGMVETLDSRVKEVQRRHSLGSAEAEPAGPEGVSKRSSEFIQQSLLELHAETLEQSDHQARVESRISSLERSHQLQMQQQDALMQKVQESIAAADGTQRDIKTLRNNLPSKRTIDSVLEWLQLIRTEMHTQRSQVGVRGQSAALAYAHGEQGGTLGEQCSQEILILAEGQSRVENRLAALEQRFFSLAQQQGAFMDKVNETVNSVSASQAAMSERNSDVLLNHMDELAHGVPWAELQQHLQNLQSALPPPKTMDIILTRLQGIQTQLLDQQVQLELQTPMIEDGQPKEAKARQAPDEVLTEVKETRCMLQRMFASRECLQRTQYKVILDEMKHIWEALDGWQENASAQAESQRWLVTQAQETQSAVRELQAAQHLQRVETEKHALHSADHPFIWRYQRESQCGRTQRSQSLVSRAQQCLEPSDPRPPIERSRALSKDPKFWMLERGPRRHSIAAAST